VRASPGKWLGLVAESRKVGKKRIYFQGTAVQISAFATIRSSRVMNG
jgi:hypothetical protein